MLLLLWNVCAIFCFSIFILIFILFVGCVSLSHTWWDYFKMRISPVWAQLFRTDRHECKSMTHYYWAAGKWFWVHANNECTLDQLELQVCTWISVIDRAGLSCRFIHQVQLNAKDFSYRKLNSTELYHLVNWCRTQMHFMSQEPEESIGCHRWFSLGNTRFMVKIMSFVV